jgi:hypothetical protein
MGLLGGIECTIINGLDDGVEDGDEARAIRFDGPKIPATDFGVVIVGYADDLMFLMCYD